MVSPSFAVFCGGRHRLLLNDAGVEKQLFLLTSTYIHTSQTNHVQPLVRFLVSFLDFGWYGFKPSDPAVYKTKQESELMNGRLAMMALGGIATQSVISGGGFPYL